MVQEDLVPLHRCLPHQRLHPQEGADRGQVEALPVQVVRRHCAHVRGEPVRAAQQGLQRAQGSWGWPLCC